jgi:preprotein translocase subunit SecB
MEVKLSPLKLMEFALLRCVYDFKAPSSEEEFSNLYDNYSLDIEFDINPTNTGLYHLSMKVSVNTGESIAPGYSITAEGLSIYDFDSREKISDDEKRSMLNYSGVSISINNLRSAIMNITGMAPFGRYIFPPVDVVELLNKRLEKEHSKYPPHDKSTVTKSRKKKA